MNMSNAITDTPAATRAPLMLEPGQELLLCALEDLVPDSGVCTLIHNQQIAVFWLPALNPQFYAIGNYDPLGKANVLSRGMVGDVKGEPVVASPLYKQHFSLVSGRCLEQPQISVATYRLQLRNNLVYCLGQE